jgi:hypothetical protein
LSVNGNATYRIFYFSTGTSTISGLTISNGAIVGPSTQAVTGAGAIFNQGVLIVNDCTVSNNQALGSNYNGPGGGDGGTVEGGAIANSGTLTLNRCTLSGNGAAGGRGGDNFATFAHAGRGGAGEGGAVFNYANGTLSVNNCTFNGNGATGGAGGNGYFGGNGGNGSGAGVFNLGTMTVTGATVSGNTGNGGAGGVGNGGSPGLPGVGSGGLAAAGGSNAVGDTVSAGNSGNNGKDVSGTFSSHGYNLIGSGDHSTGFTNGTSHDQVGTDAASINAQLGVLQNNGGPTNTMALLSGSPAINTGDPNAPSQDQRYYLRLGAPDIGAFEFGGALAPASAVSRKTHGSAGVFSVTMPLTGSVGIECRSGGATNDHQLMLTFATPVTVNGSPQAQVTSGTGQIGTGGTSNGGVVTLDQTKTVVTVPLTNVANAQRIAVTLFSVSDGTNTNNVSIPMGVLVGDTTGNGAVNSSDIAQTQSQSGQLVTSSNFREDLTLNGSINSSDIAFVQSKSGTALPAGTSQSESPITTAPKHRGSPEKSF